MACLSPSAILHRIRDLGPPGHGLFQVYCAIVRGKPIEIYNHGRMQRDFTYIDDVVEGIVRVLEHSPKHSVLQESRGAFMSNARYKIYNLGNHQPVEVLKFIEIIEQAWASRLARPFARCSRGMLSPHTRRWTTCIRLQDSGLPLQLRKVCRNSCGGTANITRQGTRGVLKTSLRSACLLRDLRFACCWWPWHGRSIPVKFRPSAIFIGNDGVLLFPPCGTVLGQGTRAIKGTVEDTTRGIVAGAQVKLRNQATGQEVLANSDEQGEFQFEQLPFGDYLLIVTAVGFEPSELPIKLAEQRDSLVHVGLRIAAATESVVVSANSSPPIAGQNIDAVELDRPLARASPREGG